MATIVGIIPNAVRLDEGVYKVGDTRVSLDTVVSHFNNGAAAAEIQSSFDSMSLAQVHAAIAFYLHNKAKVDDYLVTQAMKKAKIRKELEKYSKPEMRETLLARRNGEDKNWK